VLSHLLPRAARSRLVFLRTLRSIPENDGVTLAHAVAPVVHRLAEHVPVANRIERRARGRIFEDDLRRVNDVLARSPMAGRCWLWGGVLLGWAREGRVLPHDQKDVDLAYEAADADRMQATFELLEAAGFRRWFSYRNNAGQVTESTFLRHGAKFEFWQLEPVEGEWEYHVYGSDRTGEPTQLVARLTAQERVPFTFLDREWLKVRDHEAELTALYGSWRVPDPDWDYIEGGGVIARERWTAGR
jgi:hypothetical protein